MTTTLHLLCACGTVLDLTTDVYVDVERERAEFDARHYGCIPEMPEPPGPGYVVNRPPNGVSTT